ncbi:MAG: hypothetical protein LBJ00_12005 [Planctomycetaceae bacterium]|nr:hypothetical protein [Planctomycetaceae bacterium]
MREQEIVAKTANTDNANAIHNEATLQVLNLVAATDQQNKIPNGSNNLTKPSAKGYAHISWPKQLTKRNTHYSATDSPVNETPFASDELATFDEFESISRQNNSKPYSQNLVKKQSELRSTPPKKRRRQIDPTTCERDYSSDEVEFMNALDEYKRSSGRMFPTCSEILEVLKNLGYGKKEKL